MQRRSLGIIMHTGTHSDNSKINQHQEKCYTVCLCELEKELITCGRLAAVQAMRNSACFGSVSSSVKGPADSQLRMSCW